MRGLPFFDGWFTSSINPKWLDLVGDWNAILDSKIDKVRRGVSIFGRCKNSLTDLMARYDLVDIFRLGHPTREM